MRSQPLSEIPAGETVRLVSINGGRQLARRLLSLGITPGAELEILHRRGQGVVIGRNGNRVALGRGIAEKLQAEKID